MGYKIRRGDVFYIESSFSTVGSEQRAGRPAVVVSNDTNNEFSPTVEVVYLTTQPKHELPTHVEIYSLKRESIALCEQITSVAVERIGDYCGAVSNAEMSAIETAMLVSLGIETEKSREETPPTPKAIPTDTAENLAARCSAAEARCALLQELYDSLLDKLISTE